MDEVVVRACQASRQQRCSFTYYYGWRCASCFCRLELKINKAKASGEGGVEVECSCSSER